MLWGLRVGQCNSSPCMMLMVHISGARTPGRGLMQTCSRVWEDGSKCFRV